MDCHGRCVAPYFSCVFFRLKSTIPTSELDALFGLEPDKTKDEPMDKEWLEQQERDREAKYRWMSERAYERQQDFLLRLEVSK
jgi:hypothetical protein